MRAYKLFRVRKDGSLGSPFIGKARRIPAGVWLDAEDLETKGYAHRPGWHCLHRPVAPHLSIRDRAWFIVEVQGCEFVARPERQGGEWIIVKRMRVLGRAVDM